MIFAAGGSLLGAAGQIQQGQAAARAAEYNADTLQMQASMIKEKAKVDARALRTQGIRELGSMRASYAASGVQLEGSALDVLADSARRIKRDELTTKHQGVLEAKMKMRDAQQVRMEGRAAKRAGNMAAVGTLLGGAGKMFGAA